MISTFLYSAKYWPDVYNYINANITIKRIPTISELELTVIEVDYTTEQSYTSTDGDYIEVSTVDDLDIDEFMKDEIDFTKKVKRNIVVEQLKDYIELPPRPIFVDYMFIEEPIKQETDTKDSADDVNIPKETDKNIIKTSVTGVMVEDELPKTTVSEEPAVTKKYYTVQTPKTKESRRSVDEKEATTEMTNPEPEHTTTIEGYLVGDEKKDVEVTEVPIIITTKANENELVDDEDDSQLMKDSVDVSNLSTRSSDDVEMVTRKPWKMQMLRGRLKGRLLKGDDIFDRAAEVSVVLDSVQSECEDKTKCAVKAVDDILKETSIIENVDIRFEVPKFDQIKKVAINDLNQILSHLTKWFEAKLNETSFVFKHKSNKTKIYVKSFDFKVDFEKGNANIDVDLTEESEERTVYMKRPVVTTTERVYQVTQPMDEIKSTKAMKISRILDRFENEKENEIFKLDEWDTTYYDPEEDNSTDYPILDYIEMYKDTTNEENTYVPTEVPDMFTDFERKEILTTPRPTVDPDPVCHGDWSCKEFIRTVYPWVVSIFVTNESADSQFSYYCDGALLTEKVIVTGGRCMIAKNRTLDPENVLVFLGKVNLQAFGGKEKVHKVKTIIKHPHFTTDYNGRVMNDLALLVLEVQVDLKENIQSACIHQENSLVEAATTAWGANGLLMPIFFNNKKEEHCFDMDENVFCVTYGNDVALCPSFGGVFVSKQSERWCLTGIYYGDPAERGICFIKNVFYTSLYNHLKWIDDTIGLIKKGYM
ncbi:hypothetical protein HW555_011738 [Spodoptera exigua]|uniref:Peptidase S1 domain-containing protein n=1 Tax=Spodoptera exigua TaxID=7107 RepID=A0A835G6I1_SPOEX|nr:hypothetical protein HW555_011738 [Spodoptera exigua]